MQSLLRRQVLTYLQTHHTLTLATVRLEGPWAAALFYVNDDFDLYWLSDPHTRHSENIARTHRAAVTIQEDYRDWQMIQGIQMEGSAEQVGPLAEALHPMGLYVAKYPFLENWRNPPPTLARALRPARMYRFRPSRVWFVDNARGLGNRQEVPIKP
jgi:uncharacterized protein